MKPVVDCDTCIGCGLCEDICPDVFRLMEDGCAHVLTETPAHDLYADIQEAADACPVDAITVIGE